LEYQVHKEAVFTSIAVIETYFQSNQCNSSIFHPIAITAKKRSTGWAFSSEKPRMGLVDIVQHKVGKQIFIKEFDGDDAPAIQGVCVEQEKSATIYVKKNLNFCWRRFIVAKELSHLLMNTVDNELRCTDLEKVKEILSYLVTTPENNAQLSESVAYLGAMELLIPKQYLDKGLFTSPEVADNIKCPKQIIELRETGRLQSTFNSLYSDTRLEMAGIIDKLNRANACS
jgi:Zn-dependent peptidase ImmA (M78 family)